MVVFYLLNLLLCALSAGGIATGSLDLTEHTAMFKDGGQDVVRR
jgi:hypothetical protein